MLSSEIFIAAAADRFSTRVLEEDGRIRRRALSSASSLAIHAILIALTILAGDLYAERLDTIETPVEILVEAPPPAAEAPPPQIRPAPTQPVSPPPLAAKARAPSRVHGGFDAREIAEAERRRKAELGKATRNGDGTATSDTAAPDMARQKRDADELDPDPRKEISRLVPARPKTAEQQNKNKIAPPGPERKAITKEMPKTETAEEATRKDQPLQCGLNARRPVPTSPVVGRGQVLGEMTRDQAYRMIQMTQANADMYISAAYIDNVRVMVHPEGAWIGSWVVVLLPRGLNVQTGDYVEYVHHHLDPARPCHYIPNLASRIL